MVFPGVGLGAEPQSQTMISPTLSRSDAMAARPGVKSRTVHDSKLRTRRRHKMPSDHHLAAVLNYFGDNASACSRIRIRKLGSTIWLVVTASRLRRVASLPARVPISSSLTIRITSAQSAGPADVAMTLRFWDESMPSRLNDQQHGMFIVIMQRRLHERDLSGTF